MRRRNATTEFLKECIADALLQLIKTKSMETITIQEITDLADVGRVTYYRNFSSKEDVLKFKLNLLCQGYLKGIEESIPQGVPKFSPLSQNAGSTVTYPISHSFFSFILSIKDVVVTLQSAGQIHILLHAFYKMFLPHEQLPMRETYQRSFLACGLFGFVIEWIENDFAQSPDELSDMLMNWCLEI